MESIRRGVFETNSSSTHSLTICSESEYERWKKGELFYSRYNGEFKTKEQIIEDAKKSKEDCLEKQKNGDTLYRYQEEYVKAETDEALFKLEASREEWEDFDSFWDYVNAEYETFIEGYTTKNGEEIITFGYYGYDG